MAFSFFIIASPAYAANTPTAIFTAPPGYVRVDAFSVNNVDTVVRTIDVYIVPSGGSAGADNQIVTAQAVLPGESWQCAEIIGQVLLGASTIVVSASAASALVVAASGLLQT